MRLRACACWLIMTPELVDRVDAWIRDHAAPFWLAFDWQGARDILVYRRSKCGAEGEAARASTAAVMRGILLGLVRRAWDEPDATVQREEEGWHVHSGWPRRDPLAPHFIGLQRAAVGAHTARTPEGLPGVVWTLGRRYARWYATEDEALVAALEAAPRPTQIGGAS